MRTLRTTVLLIVSVIERIIVFMMLIQVPTIRTISFSVIKMFILKTIIIIIYNIFLTIFLQTYKIKYTISDRRKVFTILEPFLQFLSFGGEVNS